MPFFFFFLGPLPDRKSGSVIRFRLREGWEDKHEQSIWAKWFMIRWTFPQGGGVEGSSWKFLRCSRWFMWCWFGVGSWFLFVVVEGPTHPKPTHPKPTVVTFHESSWLFNMDPYGTGMEKSRNITGQFWSPKLRGEMITAHLEVFWDALFFWWFWCGCWYGV